MSELKEQNDLLIYKDKNDNWINGYCINAKNITIK